MFANSISRRSTARRPKARRPWVEFLEGRQLLATFAVTNILDSGPGSLRQAITSLNDAPAGATNTINFSIGAAGVVETIDLMSPLPEVTRPVLINGATESGTGPTPLVVVDGTGAGSNASGFSFIGPATGSTLEGLAVVHFSGSGVLLDGVFGVTVSGDDLGTADGVTHLRNGVGITLTDKAAGDSVLGNTILGNTGDGVDLDASTSNSFVSNTILENKGNGLDLAQGSNSNAILGNLIGTNLAGAKGLGNLKAGVVVDGSSSYTIGGAASGSKNVVAENETQGIVIEDAAKSNVVEGNAIGTDLSGENALGNVDSGVLIQGASGNTVGLPGAGNTI